MSASSCTNNALKNAGNGIRNSHITGNVFILYSITGKIWYDRVISGQMISAISDKGPFKKYVTPKFTILIPLLSS